MCQDIVILGTALNPHPEDDPRTRLVALFGHYLFGHFVQTSLIATNKLFLSSTSFSHTAASSVASKPLKLLIKHILAPKEYLNNPHQFTVQEDEWENWLDSECAVYTNWCFEKDTPIPKSDRVRMFEWKKLYECDHAGQPTNCRDPNKSPSKRRKTRQSIKVDCMAKIEVYKSVGDEVITIDYYWKQMAMVCVVGFSYSQYSYYSSLAYADPVTLQGMKESRNPDAVRRWLDARVREGFDRRAIRAMLRMSSEELSQLTEAIDAFPCRIKLILQYGDTICLDSTHNNCKGPLCEKMFLSSILGPDRVTGKGVPLAWLITNFESHHPLTQFLKWLRINCGFNPHSVMTDCSDTEALAINLAFPGVSVKILYCYWHLWEAWDAKIKSKVVVKGRCPEDRAEILQHVRKDVITLLKCKKVADFDTQ
ncbi:hypothetical protein M422DRAFT_240188 [Sphaerobolus stellatus SS14]|nr:hypothetical protein M422DRAFT_240188 [Sphaerobolus stellatus SS14]